MAGGRTMTADSPNMRLSAPKTGGPLAMRKSFLNLPVRSALRAITCCGKAMSVGTSHDDGSITYWCECCNARHRREVAD